MSIRPIVVGAPQTGGIEACERIDGGATLVWSSYGALREVAEQLDASETLLVDPADRAACAMAVTHRLQLYGTPHVVVAAADDATEADAVLAIVDQLLRRIPPVPVILTGMAREQLRHGLTIGPEPLYLEVRVVDFDQVDVAVAAYRSMAEADASDLEPALAGNRDGPCC